MFVLATWWVGAIVGAILVWQKGGKLAEHWVTRDDLSAMLQLGLVEPPGPPR